MPVYRTNSTKPVRNSVHAKDEWTDLRFLITPSKETRLKFAKVGRPDRCWKCFPYKCICYDYPRAKNRHTPEETLILQNESRLDVKRLGRLASLVALRDRISSPPPSPSPSIPLVDRLAPPPVHIPPPIPDNMHFRKTKLLNRIKEFYVMMNATRTRLDPIAEKLNEDELRQYDELEVKVPQDIRDKVWMILEEFNRYYEDLETLGHRMTNKNWRKLRVAVKTIGAVSFTNLDDNLLTVCNNLLARDIKFS